MKSLLSFVTIALFLGCADSPNAPTATLEPAAKKAPKVDVCHAISDGTYKLLNISGNALNAHLNHGDVLPGSEGLDESCNLIVVCDVTFDEASALCHPGEIDINWTTSGSATGLTYIMQQSSVDPEWTDVATVTGDTGSFSITVPPPVTPPFTGFARIIAVCSATLEPVISDSFNMFTGSECGTGGGGF
jgi:hypothetical protein